MGQAWFGTPKKCPNPQIKPPLATFKSDHEVEFKKPNGEIFKESYLSAALQRGDKYEFRKEVVNFSIDSHWQVRVGSYEFDVWWTLVDWLLHERVSKKDTDMGVVQELLKLGADVNKPTKQNGSPLHRAAAVGNAQLVELLVQHGAEINLERPHDQRTPLHESANREVVEALLKLGADIEQVDGGGLTPLAFTARTGRKAQMLALLENGAKVNTEGSLAVSPAVMAVMAARGSDEEDILEILLQHNLDLSHAFQLNQGWLHSLCKNGRKFTIVCALISHGCPLDETNEERGFTETALHVAIRNKNYDIVWRLVLAGASTKITRINAKEFVEQTVEDLCAGNQELLRAVRQVWTPETNRKFPKCVRDGIKCATLVFRRLNNGIPQHVMYNILSMVAFDWHSRNW
eukprot:Phypoly_transcript_09886.p1 GENE.Phypoly_transcript_09886~~Phypoly_transcript_09886.p1  ORF type:complete len:426 (+),score=64.94 Phypoly_transcript_09886:72-1280(+)